MLIPVSMQRVKDISTCVSVLGVGHLVPFSNTERHLSATRVNFIHVFLDNLGYFGDPGHGEPDHIWYCLKYLVSLISFSVGVQQRQLVTC